MCDFTPEQKMFLSSSGMVVLHACPGSGKTTVVAKKAADYIRSWHQPHQGIALLSFTNVASEEINRQVCKFLPEGREISSPHFIGTLDSFINNFIFLRFGYLLLSKPKRPILATKDITKCYPYWRRECYGNSCVSNITQFRWNASGVLTKNGACIDCVGKGGYDPPCVQFKGMMRKKGMFFQDEIPGLACVLLRKYPEVAKSVATRFPVIILDEAQDTSVEQMEVLDLLCQAGMESVYIVGDPDQAIYEWRTADPESFLKKMKDDKWEHLTLSKNFRSSQLICNAVYVFSDVLKDRSANEALGAFSHYTQKPIVLLYDKSANQDSILAKFKELCVINKIKISPQKVAVVTRGRINSEYDIKDLWKTVETELLANAAYEWMCGKRKKAYELCERAIFQLTIKPFEEIDISIEEDASRVLPHENWRQLIIDVLINLPSPNESCRTWVADTKHILDDILNRYHMSIINGQLLPEMIKIKSRDSKKPDFKEYPVRVFFETKIQNEYTRASVHGVKGETFDALLLLVDKLKGNTITPSFLARGDTKKELMRIAYVAMTRPRKLLVVAMPKSSVDISNRFPEDKWDYIEM